MTDRADLVVVGAGTVGGWASVFAAEAGVGRVVVLERGLAGDGASSRAAGIVRAQGGTPATVALGRWSIDFYRGQAAAYGTDSGFRELGYLILAVTEEDERLGRERVAMQHGAGLTDVRWLDAAEAAATVGTLSPEGHRGGSFRDGDGHIDPPRNVRAYSLAMQAAGVELRERTAFTGLRTSDDGARVTGVETTGGVIETERVLLTGGPVAAVGRLAGRAADPGGCRAPHGRRARAARSVRRRADADGLRSRSRPLLAPRGRRAAVRLERSGRGAGGGARDRLGGVRALPRAARRLRAGHAGSRAAQDLGGDDRLHARPSADPGSGAPPGRLGHRWGHDRVGRGPRDDVGTRRGARGRGPGGARCDVAHRRRRDYGLDRFDEQGRSRLAPDSVALPFPAAAD